MAATRRTSARLSGDSNDADFPAVAILKGKVNGGQIKMRSDMGVDQRGDEKRRKLATKKQPMFKPQPISQLQPHSSTTPPDSDEMLDIPPPPPSERKIARQRKSMAAGITPLSPESPPVKRQKPNGAGTATSIKPPSSDADRLPVNAVTSSLGASTSSVGAAGSGQPRKIDFLNLTSLPRSRPSMPRPVSPPRALLGSTSLSQSAPSRTSLGGSSVLVSAVPEASGSGSMGPPAMPFIRKTRKSMSRMGMPSLPPDLGGDSEVPIPDSETPMIRKNQRLREDQSRRSSLGKRGQRASSSLGRGEISIPHPSVDPAQYYTHIAPTIPEAIRARHLLVYCAKKASDTHLSSSQDKGKEKNRSKEKGKDKDSAARTEEGDRLVSEIMESFMVGLGKGEVETNVFSMGGAPSGSSVQPHPQNVSNRQEEAKAERVIRRGKEEKQAWTTLKTRANKRQKLVIEGLRSKNVSADKPDMTGMPEWMIKALESADEVIAQGKGILEDKGEFSDVEFKIDLLHQSTHTALQYSLQATRFLDGVFATLSSDLQSKEPTRKTTSSESDGPDTLSLLSAATAPSAPPASSLSTRPAPGKGKSTAKSDPIHLLRALAAADSRSQREDTLAAAQRLQPVTAAALASSSGSGLTAAQTPRRSAPTPRTAGGGTATMGTNGVRGRIYGRGTQVEE